MVIIHGLSSKERDPEHKQLKWASSVVTGFTFRATAPSNRKVSAKMAAPSGCYVSSLIWGCLGFSRGSCPSQPDHKSADEQGGKSSANLI